MSLNAEPSQPEVREAEHLPPKSYAQAVDETPEQTNGSETNGDHSKPNGIDHENGAPNGILNAEPSKPEDRDAQNLPPKSYAEATEENLDDTKGDNKKTTFKKLTGSGMERSSRPGIQAKDRKHSEKEKIPKDVVLEEVRDGNGHNLISIKPAEDYDKFVEQSKAEKKPHSKSEKSELVSGRRAGAGWDKSPIRFAPLNVPLQRRLQTLAVLIHTLTVAICLTTFFFLCAIPLLWPVLVPYLLYVLFSNAHMSGELSHRSKLFRGSVFWSLFASYFPARLHRTQELPPTRKYIFGYHPHGIISFGAFVGFGSEALGFAQLFPGITNSLLTLDANFRIPLYRDYLLRMGLASVSRESCENILSKGGHDNKGMGRGITIVVGGARESLDAHPNRYRLVLNQRKGFVKMAIRTGADLVPVLSFGENDVYEQFDGHTYPRLHRFQLLVKKMAGFTVPLFHARGVFNYDVGMMPYRRPMNIVVGRAIKVVKQEYPDAETVDRVHKEYVDELRRIWDDWKDTFAKDREEELEIID